MKRSISKHPLWRRWTQIKFMMTNENHKQHHNYIGLEMTGFDNFWEFADMVESTIGELPSATHKLARLDHRRGYVRGNLFWAESNAAVGQRIPNIQKFKIGRRTMTYRQMSDESGICEYTIRSRIERGWTAKDAMMIPPALGNRVYGMV